MKRLLLVAMAVIPFLFSCPTGDYFSDIEGINLLSVDEQAFTGWEIDYGSDDVTFEYMTFTESAQAGPSTGDTVYRMEIVNLVPNGDFKSDTLGPGWNPIGGATGIINNETLEYALDSNAHRVDYDLSNAADGLVSEASYIIRFQLKSTSAGSAYFEYRNPPRKWTLDNPSTSLIYNFPTAFPDGTDATFTPNETTDIFTIGTTQTGGTMYGYIDNLRVARTDINSYITLNVPKSNMTRTDLPSGEYRFTVYVKDDPDVTPTTVNRMPASAVSLFLLSAADALVSGGSYASFEAADDWSDWTALSVTGHIQVDNDAETALRLRITPTDISRGSYGRDVGSLLISSPVLEYSSDGSF